MNRSRIIIVLCLLCSPLHSDAAESTPRNVAPPNVLFMAIDDLNDWIGVLGGHPQSRTPNIDRLAKRGVLFTNCHCAAPACNPSRAALMTGIRPSTSGVYHNPQPWRKAMPRAVTLPQHFMEHGYTALGAGTIYHGKYPDPASWDSYYPAKDKNRPADPRPAGRPLNGIKKSEKEYWRKFALWERATKTPMLFVVPGLTKAAQRCDRPVNLLDVYPTLVDICGLPARSELEGISLRPLLEKVKSTWDRPTLTTHGRNNHAIRSERYRYIRYEDGSEELYDHASDPNEWKNLATDATLAEVKDELAAWLPTQNAPDADHDE